MYRPAQNYEYHMRRMTVLIEAMLGGIQSLFTTSTMLETTWN